MSVTLRTNADVTSSISCRFSGGAFSLSAAKVNTTAVGLLSWKKASGSFMKASGMKGTVTARTALSHGFGVDGNGVEVDQSSGMARRVA